MVKVPPGSYTPDPRPPTRTRPSEFWKGNPLGFDEHYWVRGIPLPTMLPVRLTKHRVLVSVNGSTYMGADEGERVYVVKASHEHPSPGNKVIWHPYNPGTLFYLWKSDYTIG
jgi:hypothetical protein